MKRSRIGMATAVAVAAALALPAARAALTAEATAALAGSPLYLPASPANPGGLKGYEHGSQLDFAFEAHAPSKNNALKEKLKKAVLNKAVAGPKVRTGSYTLAPAPDAEPD
ncbi:hypothetical protein [Cupriavidus necator]|uniref:hypothetical protein n=1 Tax=Cupriavidus necator TaxID=106590 RepID=UPI00277EF466|nr:hypothetical protein [Cupriavidus necator]MDQ0140854.1 hypothetical protein [Cupriavidus necator]